MNKKARIEKLEKIKRQNTDTQIRVRLIHDDKIIDDDGKEYTPAEYKEKYKDDPEKILVGFPDNETDDDITRVTLHINSKDKKENKP